MTPTEPKGVETTSDLLRHYADVRRRLMKSMPPKPVLMLAPPSPAVSPAIEFPHADGCPLNMLAQPSWRFLVALAALRNSVSPRDIIGPMRSRPVAAARHDAVHLMHHHLGWSLPKIGARIGGRDHTTVLHSVRVQSIKLGMAAHG